MEDEMMDVNKRLDKILVKEKALRNEIELLRLDLMKYAQDQDWMKTEKEQLPAKRVVEAMLRIHYPSDLRRRMVQKTSDGSEFMMVRDVQKIVNMIEETNMENKLSTARGVGSIIRQELQLRVGNRRGQGYPVFWDEAKMKELAQQYGLEEKGS